MADTKYEYKIIAERENTKFLQQVNALGRQGWKILHYHSEGMLVSAIMELSKPLEESSNR